MTLSPRSALWLFLFMVLVALALGSWWIIFMAKLVDEKVEMAQKLGAAPDFIDQIHQEEIRRQVMLGMEGIFLIALILLGGWLIYRALVRTEELKFHQQNFLMAVTHELKTPLASIQLYLDALQSPKVETARKEQVLPKMREDIARLEQMVQNILDAGRFERSGYALHKAEFDLSELVVRRVQAVRAAPSTLPKLVGESLEPQIRVMGDAAALGRAIDAILENALKYHSGDAIKIDVTLRSEERFAILSIADQGIGFVARDSKALFERFYRVGDELTRSRSGTGLGLYLCREIIRAHGGTVAACSDGPGTGATFIIKLKREPS